MPPKEQKPRSRFICITLFNKPDAGLTTINEEAREAFKSLYSQTGAQWLYGSVETCPSTGREHIQGVIRYKNPRNSWNPLSLIWPHAKYFISTSTDPFADNLFYTSKEQQDPANIIELGERPAQGKRSDLQSAVDCLREHGLNRVITDHTATFAKYSRNIKELDREFKRIKYAPQPDLDIVWRSWQRDLLDIIEGQPDPRKIHFRVDPTGNAGKSFFANELARRRLAYIVSGGKHDRIQHGYDYQPVIIFDIPRSTFDESTGSDGIPYAVIENFKNGMANRMYGDAPIFFKTPHIIVFSNYQPNMNKLSSDRFEIQEI